MSEMTIKVNGIKPVPSQSTTQAYEIPVTKVMDKADGTGTVEVVIETRKVTKAQVIQTIAALNKGLVQAQATLDAINNLEAK